MVKATPQGSVDPSFSEEFNRLKKETQSLLRPYLELLQVKPGDLKTAQALDPVLKRRTDCSSLARELHSVLERVQALRDRINVTAVENFKMAFASFIRAEQAGDCKPREIKPSTWRLGRLSEAIHNPVNRADRGILELEADPGRQAVRVYYDGQELVGWTAATTLEEIQGVVDGAYAKLESCLLPNSQLTRLFASAYLACARSRAGVGSIDSGLVPVKDFLCELRVEMTREEVARSGASAKLKFNEFPHWAYLYNIDRYQAIPGFPDDVVQVAFQVGTQASIREGHSVKISIHGQDHRLCTLVSRANR